MAAGLEGSRALWNRNTLRLDSDETLAQLLDRGEIEVWRELYALAREDEALRKRMLRVVSTVPVGLPHFWKAALESLGEGVTYERSSVPEDAGWA